MDNYVFDDEESTEAKEVTEEEETTEEEGGAFMKGYNDEKEPDECAECGTAVKEERKVVRAMDDEEYVFCSEDCA